MLQPQKKLQKEIEQTRHKIEDAERRYDLEELAMLKHGKLPELEKKLESERENQAKSKAQLLKEEVTEDEIAEIISKWTGIPVTKLVESEREKLLHLPSLLHNRVIGQDEAVDLVADAA